MAAAHLQVAIVATPSACCVDPPAAAIIFRLSSLRLFLHHQVAILADRIFKHVIFATMELNCGFFHMVDLLPDHHRCSLLILHILFLKYLLH
jgi:hypothetical protein